MTLPIMVVSRLPRISALTKSPTAGMKTSSDPANTPGIDSGSVTRRKALRPAGVQVSGGLDQVRVDLLERDVQRQDHERQEVVGQPADDGERRGQNVAAGRQQPRSLSVPSRKPLSARISFHDSVRMMNAVKNGRITSSSRMFLARPPRKAIV